MDIHQLRRTLRDRIKTNLVIIHSGGDDACDSLLKTTLTLQSVIKLIDDKELPWPDDLPSPTP